MPLKQFVNVWILPAENTWKDFKILAYYDIGTLTVSDHALEYCGQKDNRTVRDIRRVSYGKQGRDFVNNWVKVEYEANGAPVTVFFADGSYLGWGGLLGGTKRLLKVIQSVQAGMNR